MRSFKVIAAALAPTLFALGAPGLAQAQPMHAGGTAEICAALKADEAQLNQNAETLKFGLKRELPGLIDFGRRIEGSKPDPETKKFAIYATDTADDALAQAAKLDAENTRALANSMAVSKAFCGK